MDLEISNNKDIKNSSFSKELENHLKTAKYSVDRFEENFAICENLETGEMVNIEKKLLPENTKIGSILNLENGIYTLDIEKTKERQDHIKNMVNNLFKK